MMITKKKYNSPEIITVDLDVEISLILTSDPNPMYEPTDWATTSPDNFNEDPFEQL